MYRYLYYLVQQCLLCNLSAVADHICNSHPQLRHYISTVDEDTLYFISNNEVHAIDLPTDRRERITTVHFVPTCLGAGYGWICVGGYNKGQCVFIDLRDDPPFGRTVRSAVPAEVDELLPLDLDPHPRLLGHHQSRALRPATRRDEKKVNQDIGGLIVNAITIFKYVHKSIDVPDETVAVLA